MSWYWIIADGQRQCCTFQPQQIDNILHDWSDHPAWLAVIERAIARPWRDRPDWPERLAGWWNTQLAAAAAESGLHAELYVRAAWTPDGSILRLDGRGAEIWCDTDPLEYVEELRRKWFDSPAARVGPAVSR